MISVHDVIAFIEIELALRATHAADPARQPALGSLPLDGAGTRGRADVRHHRQSDASGAPRRARADRAG